MIFLSLILIGTSIFLYLWWVFKDAWAFFQRLDIPYLKPNSVFGSIPEAILMTKPSQWIHLQVYHRLEPHKFGGIFQLHKPNLVIRDPDLIKNIVVKDFEHFAGHGVRVNKETEPLSNHLFNMEGT